MASWIGKRQKSIGFDWISLKFVSPRKEFFEMELA